MKNKIIDIEKLAERGKEFRAAGKRLVATNGCFDLLHLGHVRYLQAARALGDALVVDEKTRAEMLAALESVDLVTIFFEMRATQFLEAAAPAIYAKGGDYSSETLDAEERAILQKLGAEIRIIPFEEGYSTSGLLERLRGLPK